MPEISDKALRKVTDQLLRERAMDFRDYKPSTLRRRIQRRLDATGCADIDCYVEYLETHPTEYTSLIDMLLINVTEFFREPDAWEVIAKEVIPRILADKQPSQPIKMWSAGCATGEEAYTLAMLVSEAIGTKARDREVRIYATDIDDNALTVARHAEYSDESVEHVPEELRGKYFVKNGVWTVDRDLRKLVIFGKHNLATDAPISHCDLVVCRNVLIYMNVDLQNRLLSKFHYALDSPGYLFLGRAEAMLSLSKLFGPFNEHARIFAKEAPGGFAGRETVEQQAVVRAIDTGAAEYQLISQFNEAVLRYAPVGVLAIDGDNIVRLMNPSAERIWEIRARNLLGKSITDQPLSCALQSIVLRTLQVKQDHREFKIEEMAVSTEHGKESYVCVNITPVLDVRGKVGGLLILTEDITDQVRLRRELETASEGLHATNEELETTNEELQSTNEELQTTNEELQSTNEELETTNEELQATNEELNTTNDELEARTTQLNRLSDKMEDANDKLSALNDALILEAAERLKAENRLQAILAAIPSGIIVAEGLEGKLTVINRQGVELFGREPEPGLASINLAERLNLFRTDGEPMKSSEVPVNRALQQGESVRDFEMQVRQPDGRRLPLIVNAVPMLDDSGKVTGAVAVWTDITQMKEAQATMQQAYDRERNISQTLQKSLLSPVPEKVGDFRISAKYLAAREEAEVGGDFYHAARISDDRFIVVLGDVAGKGLEAAVLGSMTKYMMLGFVFETPAPDQMLERLNQALSNYTTDGRFVTMFYMVLDLKTGKIQYGNAGHEPAIHMAGKTREITQLEGTGPALGVNASLRHSAAEASMEAGDLLLLYTDGISEAGHPHEMLGVEGIAQLLVANASQEPSKILDTVHKTATRVSGGKLTDDAATILIGRK